MSDLDYAARYAVDGWAGVAFRIQPHTVEVEPEAFLVCEVEDCEHGDDACWAQDEEAEEIEAEGWVQAIMVGDDLVHVVEVSELTRIGEDDYCHECGQIGCTHDGRDRD